MVGRNTRCLKMKRNLTEKEKAALEFSFYPYLSTFLCGLLRINRRYLRSLEVFEQMMIKFIPQFLAANWLILCEKSSRK